MVAAIQTERSWYEVKAATRGMTDIFLYDQIGMFGISARAFVGALNAIKTAAITVYINSPGGSADDAVAMFHALRRHPATVTTVVDGLAASAASVVVQAGARRKMMAGSTMMVHSPWSGLDAQVVGNATDMRGLSDEARKQAEYLDKMAANIAAIYVMRAGGTEAHWRAAMEAETWFRAQEAVDAGLADEVVSGAGIQNRIGARTFNLAKFRHAPAWAQRTAPTPAPAPGIDYAQVRRDVQTRSALAKAFGLERADRAMEDILMQRRAAQPDPAAVRAAEDAIADKMGTRAALEAWRQQERSNGR